MTLKSLLSHWRAEPTVGGNVAAWNTFPAKTAELEPFPDDLHPDLATALESSGIRALYSHQARAWEHIHHDENLVIATGTASGKSLCYDLPVLDALRRDPETRALYLFPTKALAQDQAAFLGLISSNLENSENAFLNRSPQPTPKISGQSSSFIAALYDGDTPSSHRPQIRSQAQIVISNPDMLHTGILPHHTAWSEFFCRLRYVIIDEIHVYRGVFGSHVANVLRRLQRVCNFYGSRPFFILTSATIGNPAELAQKLIGKPVTLISEDGSTRGPQHFLMYNPPVVNRQIGLRKSAAQEAVRLADDLLTYNVQTILFARSRRSVEIILTYLRQQVSSWIDNDRLEFHPNDDNSRTIIRGYRSGYLPRQRREIERGLRRGDVRAVVATNALELGIDIGGMGAALLVGYPGSIAATWQQAGRAGRGQADSLAVLITTADPLDQFLAHHPGYLLSRTPEHALINPDNLLILLDHLRCAAFELPFYSGEAFGNLNSDLLGEFLDFLVAEGILHHSGERYFWMVDQYPAQSISLRSAAADNVLLNVNQGGDAVVIGQVDYASAARMVHPGAVYLHEGKTYTVIDLDLVSKVAALKAESIDYYTEPLQESTVQLLEKMNEAQTDNGLKAYGEILVTSQVTGYRKIKWFTHEHIGAGQVVLPPSELRTTGYWFALSEDTIEGLRQRGLWRNDPIDYGPTWLKQRDLARARDGYRCQICGKPESGRAHDVHHIVPFRSCLDADGKISYQLANRLDNLTTLCPVCHRHAETAVRVRSGLAGLAYVCSHLAPIFLMCDSRDLGVHMDPQSPLTDGAPTVVLYDMIPAGIGFSQRLFEVHSDLMINAHELVAACECEDGCPSCVGPGGESGLGGKQETLAILASHDLLLDA